MVRVVVETVLDAPIDRVWAALQRPATLRHISAPLLIFRPVDPPELPDTWSERDYRVAMRFLGVLPIGRQVISVSIPPPDGDTRQIRDNGHSAMVRRWDHWIAVRPDGARTRYRDTVEIEAGLFTPLVVGFAHVFYRHRQRRWARMLANGLDRTAGGREA